MKISLRLLPWILFAIAGAVIYFLYQDWEYQKAEKERWKQNHSVEVAGPQLTVQPKHLTIAELIQNDPNIERTLDSLGIRRKEVQYVTRYKSIDTGSTKQVLVRDTVYVDTTKVPVATASINEPCFKQSITIIGDSVEESRKIITELDYFGYWSRPREFRIFKWKVFEFGPRQDFITVVDRCRADSLIANQHIKIIKK
jgi:hypothetical protein